MKYKKIINLVDDKTNQPSKFRIRNCVKINDESKGTYIIPGIKLNLNLR